jgi:hypothetical protein
LTPDKHSYGLTLAIDFMSQLYSTYLLRNRLSSWKSPRHLERGNSDTTKAKLRVTLRRRFGTLIADAAQQV